jgi:hypothetical protein
VAKYNNGILGQYIGISDVSVAAQQSANISKYIEINQMQPNNTQ